MNERIRRIRKDAGMTMAQFGGAIGISAPAVSQLESGKTQATPQTLSFICHSFNVNETWLKTGEGEPYIELSKKEKLAEFFGDVLRDADDSFRIRLIEGLACLDEAEWAILASLCDKILKGE